MRNNVLLSVSFLFVYCRELGIPALSNSKLSETMNLCVQNGPFQSRKEERESRRKLSSLSSSSSSGPTIVN
jgi:hypothetical protein